MISVNKKDLCKLYCRVVDSSAFYRLDKKVVDGTKCTKGGSHICVNGKCRVSTMPKSLV